MRKNTLLLNVIDEISMGPFGSDIKVDNFIPSGIPVLNGSNLTNKKLVEDSFNYISKEKADSLRKANANRGDVVITHRGTLGQVSYIPENSKYERYVISQSQFRIRFNMDVNPIYLTYLFHTEYGQKKLLSFKNHVGVPALAQATSNFKVLELLLHDKIEQDKIAALLSTIDDKIELNYKINAELEAMAKILYDYWFVQFDFPNTTGEPYKTGGGKMVYSEILKKEIPEGWKVKRLGDLATSINTGLNPREHFKLGEGRNYYITIKNIEYGRIVFDSSCDLISDESLKRVQQRSRLEKGDILFTSIEPVGKTYLLHENPSNWNINESVFSFKPAKLVSSEFLFMLLSSDEIRLKCKNVSTGSIHQGIRITPLKEFNVLLPVATILKDFSEMASHILKKIDNNQKQNRQLTDLREWLLPMLMNGQVTIKDSQANELSSEVSESNKDLEKFDA